MANGTSLGTEDRTRIDELLTEYGWRLDHGRPVGELFTRDGAVLAPAIGITLRGRDAITAHFLRRHETPGLTTLHTWSGLRIHEVSHDTVRLRTIQSTFLKLASEAPGIKHHMLGETEDLVRHDEGAWRFAERRLEVIFPLDVALVPAK